MFLVDVCLFQMEDSYYYEPEEVLQKLNVDPNVGLDESRVIKERETYGWNGRFEIN